MIRIRKPASPPAVLTTTGKQQTKDDHKAFAADRKGFRSGVKKFDFDRGIYAADEVKVALRTAQYDKCAFCEAKVTHITDGDIEHFRPKSAVKQNTGGKLEYPGYFWLAYEWDNLLLACNNCNRRHKGNLFPLLDLKKRCRPGRKNLAHESPLFINPAAEDPALFIEFVGETVIAKGGNHRGQATIDALGLDRTELIEHRLTRLRVLQQLQRDLVAFQSLRRPTQGQKQLIADLQAMLAEHQQPDAEYSAMACAFLC